MHLLDLDLPVPDHPTLSRRAATLEVPRPRSGSRSDYGHDTEPVHLLVDSTGLKLCGPGEWLIEKHGTKTRRSWRKLHLGVDADTGQIVASVLTSHDADDGAQVGPLLDQVAGPVASFTSDGAYDQDGVYASVAERHPDATIIVPPRATAVPSQTAESAPTPRDRHLQLIAEKGRMAWQKASGYTKRARAEAAIGRWKQVIGDRLRAHTTGCARIRMSVGRPRWTSPSTSSIACSTWDARAPSASPDPDGIGVSAAAPLIRAPRCRPPHENAQAARLLRRPHANEPHRLS